MQVVRALKNW